MADRTAAEWAAGLFGPHHTPGKIAIEAALRAYGEQERRRALEEAIEAAFEKADSFVKGTPHNEAGRCTAKAVRAVLDKWRCEQSLRALATRKGQP